MADPTPTNGYCTLAQFRARFYDANNQSVYTTDDTAICLVITGVSRAIDQYCARTFYARTETRLFDVPPDRQLNLDDDLISITTLTNGDGTVLTTADYWLLPPNASPKYAIKLKQSSDHYWTIDDEGNSERAISVAGSWGWAATAPADITEACIIQSMRIFKRKDAPFGVAGSADMGQAVVISKLDPDVALLLAPYRRRF